MAVFSSIIAGIGLAVGVASTFAQLSAQRSAAREQKKAQAASRRIEAERTRRSRVQAIRQAQIARAQAQATGQSLGVADGSGVSGGASAVGANTSAALGSASQISGLSRDISVFNQNAADAQARAGVFGQVAGFGFGVANFAFRNAGAIDRFLQTPTPAPIPSGISPGARIRAANNPIAGF